MCPFEGFVHRNPVDIGLLVFLEPSLGFTPTFPAGMVVLGGKLYLATSNLNTATMEYDPGTVISFDYADGAVDVSSGVEDSPGIKNEQAVRRFIQEAKRED